MEEFIKAQIEELTKQEQLHFANWQRIQGAKLAYQQMLEHIEKKEAVADNPSEVKQ